MAKLVVALLLLLSQASFADARNSVLDFCQRFAKVAPSQLLKGEAASYIPNSANVNQSIFEPISRFLSNFFQPAEAKFVEGWHCHFKINKSTVCRARVSLPIAQYKDFADYTSWGRLSFIKDNQITTETGEILGYATPKYYRLQCD